MQVRKFELLICNLTLMEVDELCMLLDLISYQQRPKKIKAVVKTDWNSLVINE